MGDHGDDNFGCLVLNNRLEVVAGRVGANVIAAVADGVTSSRDRGIFAATYAVHAFMETAYKLVKDALSGQSKPLQPLQYIVNEMNRLIRSVNDSQHVTDSRQGSEQTRSGRVPGYCSELLSCIEDYVRKSKGKIIRDFDPNSIFLASILTTTASAEELHKRIGQSWLQLELVECIKLVRPKSQSTLIGLYTVNELVRVLYIGDGEVIVYRAITRTVDGKQDIRIVSTKSLAPARMGERLTEIVDLSEGIMGEPILMETMLRPGDTIVLSTDGISQIEIINSIVNVLSEGLRRFYDGNTSVHLAEQIIEVYAKDHRIDDDATVVVVHRIS